MGWRWSCNQNTTLTANCNDSKSRFYYVKEQAGEKKQHKTSVRDGGGEIMIEHSKLKSQS